MDIRRQKIVLINHSDSKGGASVVTKRLMDALCAEGVEARMIVVHKAESSLRVDDSPGGKHWKVNFLAEHAEIFLRNGFNRETLFKISTAKYGLPLYKHPWVKEADAVIINWVNQGMLSLKGIAKIAKTKPVIWTMHDMWNMTGVCHYTETCLGWENGCKNCHLVGRGGLAAGVFKRKEKFYASTPIHFVAVSEKLAELCRKSPLMRDVPLSVIPNPFPVDRFTPVPKYTRLQMGLPDGHRLIVMGASRLDDPVKNLPLAIEALNGLRPGNVTAVFYGDIRNLKIFDKLEIPYVYMGRITKEDKLQSLMARADVVLSTSVWETLPGTLVEGISCGAVAVATTNGGQSDIIEEGVTGYLVDINNEGLACDKITEALEKALNLPKDKEARLIHHKMMAEKFGAPAVAREYLKLIKRMNSGTTRG